MHSVLVDLPPAVMGDVEAQQSSRVLLDAAADAHESITSDPLRRTEAVQRALGSAKALLAQLSPSDATPLILALPSLRELHSADRVRIVLQHVLATRALPASYDERKAILDSILQLHHGDGGGGGGSTS